MQRDIQKRYNSEFTQEKYEIFLKDLYDSYQKEITFRVAETPIFIDLAFKNCLIEAGNDILKVITSKDFTVKTDASIPKKYRVQNENSHPHLICIDWAVCKNENGEFIPQLIELQGFASLYAFEDFIGNKYKEHFYCPENYSHFFSGLDSDTYLELLRKTILGNHATENVVLMDLEPHDQKTRIDFYITEVKLGIKIVCLTDIKQVGKQLFYENDGRLIQIKRIYNRLIFDDLETRKLETIPFDLFGDIEVEWVAHPNWFYRISKSTMPMLHSKFVPKTTFLSDLHEIPKDLENYVLKPLYSFSGQGVLLDVQPGDIDSIEDKENWILQRKVEYAEAIQTPVGGVKCEIRMMYLWPDDAESPILATNLGRMSRGKMIGVRFNKDFDWVGGNIAFCEM